MGGAVVGLARRSGQALVAGQFVGIGAGVSGALPGGGLRAAGKQPGAYSSIVARSGAQPWGERPTTVLQSVSSAVAAGHPERRVAGVRRRAQGNARDPADAPVWLGHPGGADL